MSNASVHTLHMPKPNVTRVQSATQKETCGQPWQNSSSESRKRWSKKPSAANSGVTLFDHFFLKGVLERWLVFVLFTKKGYRYVRIDQPTFEEKPTQLVSRSSCVFHHKRTIHFRLRLARGSIIDLRRGDQKSMGILGGTKHGNGWILVVATQIFFYFHPENWKRFRF